MRVTVLDRAAMGATWGHGPTRAITVTGEIADTCPRCGGPRGVVRGLNGYEDGEHYHVNIWLNPCGHTDSYFAVVREIRALATAKAAKNNPTEGT